MFSNDNIYSLGIPLTEDQVNVLYSLILEIANKNKSIDLDKKLTSRINVKSEFHITVGVFKPDGIIFDSTRKLMRVLINYLNENKEEYVKLRSSFQGEFIVNGIGYDASNIEESRVVWISLDSNHINEIRNKIQLLFEKIKIPVDNFSFTSPHITLFMRTGSKDIHGIEKNAKEPINKYINLQSNIIKFNTISFYKGPKILLSFGDNKLNGKSSIKFKDILNEKLKQNSKNEIQYNWGNLYKSETYRIRANQIKKIIITEGPERLNKLGYDSKEIETIMNLIN